MGRPARPELPSFPLLNHILELPSPTGTARLLARERLIPDATISSLTLSGSRRVNRSRSSPGLTKAWPAEYDRGMLTGRARDLALFMFMILSKSACACR